MTANDSTPSEGKEGCTDYELEHTFTVEAEVPPEVLVEAAERMRMAKHGGRIPDEQIGTLYDYVLDHLDGIEFTNLCPDE
jgi:hypothetical protein